MRHVLVALATALLVACGGDNPSSLQQPPEPNADPAKPEPKDPLDSRRLFDVPAEPRAAAAVLVDKALDPDTGVAAMREILTRTGVKIIDVDGNALNEPSVPSKIGVRIYDFQVPMLAESLQQGGTVRLSRLADLGALLKYPAFEEKLLTDSVNSWLQAAPELEGNPEGLDAAILAQLEERRPGTLGEGRISMVGFILLAADLYGVHGTYTSEPRLGSTLGGLLPVAAADTVDCSPEKWEKWHDPWGGVHLDGPMTIIDWFNTLKDNKTGQAWFGPMEKFVDGLGLLDTALARAALVSALKLEVTNDAGSRKVHQRHDSVAMPAHKVTFTATLRFDTPFAGRLVKCGPLKGYPIPKNSKVKGVLIKWNMLGEHFQTDDSASSGRLQRGGGGGSETDQNGNAELKVVTIIENWCNGQTRTRVDTAKCGKGKTRDAQGGVEAQLDLTRTPPVNFSDLLMGPEMGWGWDVIKNLLKVLIDIATDMATSVKAVQSTVPVQYHSGPAAVLAFDSIIWQNNKCGGNNIRRSGGFKADVELLPDEDGKTFSGEGRLGTTGVWMHRDAERSCTVIPRPAQIKAHVTEDRHAYVYVDMDTDSWSCRPGASGESWWWVEFALSLHRDDMIQDRNSKFATWFELTPNPPQGKDGVRTRTWGGSYVSFDCVDVTERTTVTLRMEE